jgi:hypothetical protein
MSGGILGRRPWLLVWAAFVLLIAGWLVTYRLAQRVPHQRLDAMQEAALLKGRSVP